MGTIWFNVLRQSLPVVLALIAFAGLDVEGFIDHDRISEALSSAGLIGTILTWLGGR